MKTMLQGLQAATSVNAYQEVSYSTLITSEGGLVSGMFVRLLYRCILKKTFADQHLENDEFSVKVLPHAQGQIETLRR